MRAKIIHYDGIYLPYGKHYDGNPWGLAGLFWSRWYLALGLWPLTGFRGLQIKWCTSPSADD
jgi:hypothetical protein